MLMVSLLFHLCASLVPLPRPLAGHFGSTFCIFCFMPSALMLKSAQVSFGQFSEGWLTIKLGCTRYVPYVQTPYGPLSGLRFDQNSPNQGLNLREGHEFCGRPRRHNPYHPPLRFPDARWRRSCLIMFPNLKSSDHLSQPPICSHLRLPGISCLDPLFFLGLGFWALQNHQTFQVLVKVLELMFQSTFHLLKLRLEMGEVRCQLTQQ